MAMEGEKPVQDEIFVTICLTDAQIKHWDSSYKTKLPYERCRVMVASDYERPGAQETWSSRADMDLECGFLDDKVFEEKSEKVCRICSFSFDSSSPESGIPIELGCSCKGDLAFAHQKCAETWFGIRGNNNCEICGSKAKSLAGIGANESTDNSTEPCNDTATLTRTHRFFQGHRLLGCLLSAMLVTIFICWHR